MLTTKARAILEHLHNNQVELAELIFGRPITRCPGPRLHLRWISHVTRPPISSPDTTRDHPTNLFPLSARIYHIDPNPPYHPGRGGYNALHRYQTLRPNMTIGQALHTVSRRDLRAWHKAGWIHVQ